MSKQVVAYLSAINLHDRRPSAISTSKISHVTQNRSWFWAQDKGNYLTHAWAVNIEKN